MKEPLCGSRYFAEPNYRTILSWDPNDVPDDWRVARDRYFRLNWVRAVLTWSAFAMFLVATYTHLS